jgi:hypothetical protein
MISTPSSRSERHATPASSPTKLRLHPTSRCGLAWRIRLTLPQVLATQVALCPPSGQALLGSMRYVPPLDKAAKPRRDYQSCHLISPPSPAAGPPATTTLSQVQAVTITSGGGACDAPLTVPATTTASAGAAQRIGNDAPAYKIPLAAGGSARVTLSGGPTWSLP